MIKETDGRPRSERTKAEDKAILMQQLAELTPAQRKLVQAMLVGATKGDGDLFNFMNDGRWLRKPVSVEQFLDDPYYMGGTSQTLYPRIKQDLIEMFETPGIREVVLTGSIGYGKTTFIAFATCRLLYELSCLRAPQLAYGLSPGSEIVIALMSKSLHLSRQVMKSAVDDKVKLSPYFMEHFKPDFRSDHTFFPNNINLSIGSCFSERILGMNVLGGAMDEANFMVSKGQVIGKQSGKKATVAQFDLAEKMYASIVRRIKSRFLKAPQDLPGLMILASSAATIDSFTNRKIRDATNDSSVFVRDYAAWDVKPKQNFNGDKFFVLIGNSAVRSRVIRERSEADAIDRGWLEEQECRIIEVPIEYYDDFDRDMENAIRDIAGVSTHAISAFINRIGRIEDCVNKLQHPFETLEYDFGNGAGFLWHQMCKQGERRLPGGYKEVSWSALKNPKTARHIHIDPSLSGDSTGLAMGHIERWVEVVRRGPDGEEYTDIAPYIVIDFMLRINPPQGEQIFLPDIRRMVYELQDHGFHLQGFSCDSYQCVIGDTLVPTDCGLVPISGIVVGEMVQSRVGRKRVINAFKYENQPTIRVTTNNGMTLEGTRNHRIEVQIGWWRTSAAGVDVAVPLESYGYGRGLKPHWGWARLDQISVGTVVREWDEPVTTKVGLVELAPFAMPTKPGPLGRLDGWLAPTHLTPEFAGFLGALYGDGDVQEDGIRLTVAADEIDCAVALMERVFGVKPSVRSRNKDVYATLSLCSRPLVRWLRTNRIAKSEMRVPEAVMCSSTEVQLAFVGGLFSTDGSVSKSDGGVSLSTSSQRLAREVQVILQTAGMSSNITTIVRKHHGDYGRNNQYVVGVRGSRAVFAEKIGFLWRRKADELARHLGVLGRKMTTRVLSLVDGVSDVYDIEVEDDHAYMSNGFVSHNSAEMIQQMKARGVQSEVVSVDRTMDAYEALKSALYEKRIEFYRYEPFLAELRALEYDKVRGKVDHPVAGTKDVADAVAGMVFALVKSARMSNVIMPDLNLETQDNDDWVSQGKVMIPSGAAQSIAQEMTRMPLPFIMG